MNGVSTFIKVKLSVFKCYRIMQIIYNFSKVQVNLSSDETKLAYYFLQKWSLSN
jgi:hypothetical protein